MPVNPNTISGTSSVSTAGVVTLTTVTLPLQKFDKEARVLFTGTFTGFVGNVNVSLDGVTFFPFGSMADNGGAPTPSQIAPVANTSYWIDVGGWNYVQFVPSALVSGSPTVQLVSGANLGGAPAGVAQFNQLQALVLAESLKVDADLQSAFSALPTQM